MCQELLKTKKNSVQTSWLRLPAAVKVEFIVLESEEADTLEELKKSSAEEQAKLNKRRQKFQAQDSVLVEPLGKSMEE